MDICDQHDHGHDMRMNEARFRQREAPHQVEKQIN